MTQHTPGPIEQALDDMEHQLREAGGEAWETHPSNTPERKRADRIREAAPAMLEALRELVARIDIAIGWPGLMDATDKARAVLATIEKGE